jgi:hypothetical protein
VRKPLWPEEAIFSSMNLPISAAIDPRRLRWAGSGLCRHGYDIFQSLLPQEDRNAASSVGNFLTHQTWYVRQRLRIYGQTQFAFGLNKGVPGRGIVVPTMPVQFELLEPKAASSCKPAGNLANVSQIVCPYYTGGEIPQHLPFDF